MKQAEHYDVVVVGGGPAGICAAIGAARCGATVLLVEQEGCCGGDITRHGIVYSAYFRIGGRQIVGGIGWELVEESLTLANRVPPAADAHTPHRPGHPVVLPGMVWAMLAEEKLLQADGEVAYGQFPRSAAYGRDGWELEICGKMSTRRVVSCDVVDCTGDASVVRLAGGTCVRGEQRQPGTLTFHLTGYDVARLDAEALETAYREALATGELQAGDFCFANQPFMEYLRRGGGNCQHLFGADSSDCQAQSRANVEGRQRLLRMLRFLRRQPGLEACTLHDCCASTGIRESWRIVGRHTITAEEYLSGAAYDDAVSLTYYYIDRHHEEGIEYEFLAPGVFPEIPLGAMLPVGLPHALCAGKALSCDVRSYSALRVQASCMGMGQAAGVAAALAAKRGVEPAQLPLSDLRSALRGQGAVLPERFNEVDSI